MQVYFSGEKGFHIHILGTAFKWKPCKDLNLRVKHTLKNYGIYDFADPLVIDKVRLIRIPNTKKLSSGYWNILDPTNGFTAIHLSVLSMLPLERISKRYFFESDLLHHLNIVDAVVTDIPIPARYRGERSSLRICKVGPEFLIKHIYNFFRRLVIKYFLLNIGIASLELFLGVMFFMFGLAFGLYHWTAALIANDFVSSGRVMLAALPMIIGTQLLIAFLSHDYQRIPKIPIHKSAGK